MHLNLLSQAIHYAVPRIGIRWWLFEKSIVMINAKNENDGLCSRAVCDYRRHHSLSETSKQLETTIYIIKKEASPLSCCQ